MNFLPTKLAMRAALAGLLLLAPAARAATLSTDDQGVRVDAGAMGAFVLAYPTLMFGGEKVAHKIVSQESTGKTATITYEGGATLAVVASHDGQVDYRFDQVPADVKTMRIITLVDFSFDQGGKWKFGDGPDTPFPLVKPAHAHLYQGSATTLQLEDAQGRRIAFHVPDHSYQELNDNRAWNWSVFAWQVHLPYSPDTKVYTITVGDGANAALKPLP